MNNLSTQQKQAIEKFKRLKVGALFMKMGSGKTRTALELVNYNQVELLVYITPFSTIKNIQSEIEKWGINCQYKIVGYETIQSSDRKYLELLNELENKKAFIIADESIFIKNEETKRYQRLLNIRSKCEYALILNGTPLTKNEFDLYNQMEFLSPRIMKMNRQQFQNTFFKKITYKKKGHSEKSFYKLSDVNAELLYKMIEPYMFECDLEFDQEESKEYKYIQYIGDTYYREKEKKLDEYIEYGESQIIINMLTSLNVIASNYEKKNDAVIEYAKGKQVIVYCNFINEIEYISSKMECYVITGSTKNRHEIIEKFKNDSKPLIMTYGVGSYSLNLQFCNEIVYSSINFDYAKMEQSRHRIKRIGQERPIKYTYILTDLGITKMILENLERKMTLENLVKEKMMEGGIEWLKDI